jgi:O-antigen ligase
MPTSRKTPSKPTSNDPVSGFDFGLIIPFLLVSSYALVDFVPQYQSVDIMGPHWVYLSILNGLCILYFFTLGKNTLQNELGHWSQSLLSILFLSFFAIAGLSIFGAINRVESQVVYARSATTVLMYSNMGLMLLGRLPLLRAIAGLITLVLLVQSIQTLGQFNQGLADNQQVDTVIGNLKGNSGNKNILAASLAIELSFAIYFLTGLKNWLRLIPAFILVLGSATIVLVNARASFVSVAVQLFIFLVFCALWAIREKKIKEAALALAWVVVPIVFGAFSGNTILDQAIEAQGKPKDSGYTTIQERAKSISFNTSGRNNLWISAIDYIKKHPLIGAGIGNWKIASIPYEKETIDEFYVAYHAHNDFLEMTAETGWLGGLVFLGIFGCATFYLLSILLKRAGLAFYWHALCISLALASYFIDAAFNFPCERPIMQMFLALTLSFILSIWSSYQTQGAKTIARSLPSYTSWLAGGVAALLAFFAYTTNNKVFTSMKAQAYINTDALKLEPELSFERVNNELPSFPNLNAFCFAPDVIKSRYLIKEKRFNEALQLLTQSRKVSAQLSINEQFTFLAFMGLNNKDSAFYWIEKAFYYRPRVRNNYILYNQLLVERRDSVGIENAFKRLRPLRDEGYVWGVYLNSLAQVGASPARIKLLSDSAIKKFPGDPDMQNRKRMIADIDAKPLADQGLKYFAAQQYAKAVEYYIKAAKSNPDDYAYFENTGLCYLGQNKFSDAIVWFDKVISMGSARDAKSIFYKGVCLMRMGRKAEGCQWLGRAAGQNYPGAVEEMRANGCQ